MSTVERDEYDSHSPIEERPWTAGNPPLGWDAEHVEPTLEPEVDEMKGRHMNEPTKDPNEDPEAFGDDDADETYDASDENESNDDIEPDEPE